MERLAFPDAGPARGRRDRRKAGIAMKWNIK
jgi:hypothetical protein